MYIPDLFGAYIKGRELAIEKNWQDLKNYEAVEAARNDNDKAALNILAERADFGGKRAMFSHQVDASGRANEIGETAQAGMVATTQMLSDARQIQNGVFQNNKQAYGDVVNSLFQARLGNAGAQAGVQRARNEYWTPERQYNAGQALGQHAYNTALATGVAATDLVPAAERQIAQNLLNHQNNIASGQYSLGETNHNIALQPTRHAILAANLAHEQHQADTRIAREEAQAAQAAQDLLELKYREYISYLQKAQTGDQAAALAAQYYAQQYGFGTLQNGAVVRPPLMKQPIQEGNTAASALNRAYITDRGDDSGVAGLTGVSVGDMYNNGYLPRATTTNDIAYNPDRINMGLLFATGGASATFPVVSRAISSQPAPLLYGATPTILYK